MTTQKSEEPDDLDDLLDEDFGVGPETGVIGKGAAKPHARTKKQIAAAEKAAAKAEIAEKNKQLAQIANLLMAGYSLSDIGDAIGASADEVDRMLTADTARFVRNQPSLRVWVRNYLSGKYTDLLEAVWEEATDSMHPGKLENQDRALRILNSLAKLHGAEAPTQSEVKVDAAPEAVERMVAALAAQQGQGYDVGVFDVIEGEVVHEAAEAGRLELERSARAVEEDGTDGEADPGED